MATFAQIRNLHKCRNQYRHRWIDKGREKNGIDNYDYYCKFGCGTRRIKASAYDYEYWVAGEKEPRRLAPDCVPFSDDKNKILNIRKIKAWR